MLSGSEPAAPAWNRRLFILQESVLWELELWGDGLGASHGASGTLTPSPELETLKQPGLLCGVAAQSPGDQLQTGSRGWNPVL